MQNNVYTLWTKKAVIAAGLLLALSSCRNNDSDPINDTTSNVDKNFIKKAGISNASEIEIGQLAREKATLPSVKNYATHLIEEHTKAQTELIGLGALKNVAVPNEPDTLHKAKKAQLSLLTGVKFDSAYIASQILDHKAAIEDFDNESKNGQDADVKNYAKKYLPHLYEHLIKADSLSKNLK